MRIPLISVAAVAALLTACQTLTTNYEGDENSPYYVVPAGSRLTLNQALTIPPEHTGVYVQYGQAMPNSQVQHYYPYCRLEVQNRRDTSQTVAPGDMTVTKTVQEEIEGAYSEAAPLMLARASIGLLAQESGGYPSIRAFITSMSVRSEKQPDIYRLYCAQWGYPGIDRHVTISEIRRTLDTLFKLDLPARGG